MTIAEIKDNAPNQATVAELEKLLAWAKEGKIRTVATICGWNDDSWTHGWSYDKRNSPRRFMGEASFAHFELLTKLALDDPDSLLYNAVTHG